MLRCEDDAAWNHFVDEDEDDDEYICACGPGEDPEAHRHVGRLKETKLGKLFL